MKIRHALMNRHMLIDLNWFDTREEAVAYRDRAHPSWEKAGLTLVAFEDPENGTLGTFDDTVDDEDSGPFEFADDPSDPGEEP